ncbi:glycosyltransferase family 9 protein [Acidithiobacillus sp.]|jgi:ADP-heptose:LPS heptosyltransferase|uniref:glycosyltransferase family 9 protein n=1 Tax=Acidithiobacillus sp. TaxID=1872118 RepID=UPI0025C0C1C2|nr:glycosyltransferase family 9 protein [Acidithiobacillus sp.]MCK9187958.1 glycosyltransferase family 9 protein [Acidithiobacillus sp.]MCK9359917.1 glycosyltransferase family 9 protein [Acidithiobacillus sp.]
MNVEAPNILIYRLGSLGDTIVALPALRLIERAFPHAQRWMLTNFSVNAKAAPMAQILDGTGLVHNYLEYPVGLRNLRGILHLRQSIRKLRPIALVYLAEPRGLIKALRDAAFFRTCGIQRLIGVPYTQRFQRPLRVDGQHYEYEGARLLRCLHTLGNFRVNEDTFQLELSNSEHEKSLMVFSSQNIGTHALAVSIGTKFNVNDWGDENWKALLAFLSRRLPNWTLLTLGANDERIRSAELMTYWRGPSINLCGQLSVRESATVLQKSRFFIGHDSGPMHLAAAVGTPCVAIFSSRNLPGIWFPFGKQHRVLYQPMPCQGCNLEVCEKYDKACIKSIRVRDVMDAVAGILGFDTLCAD